jgi:hypothetical protein
VLCYISVIITIYAVYKLTGFSTNLLLSTLTNNCLFLKNVIIFYSPNITLVTCGVLLNSCHFLTRFLVEQTNSVTKYICFDGPKTNLRISNFEHDNFDLSQFLIKNNRIITMLIFDQIKNINNTVLSSITKNKILTTYLKSFLILRCDILFNSLIFAELLSECLALKTLSLYHFDQIPRSNVVVCFSKLNYITDLTLQGHQTLTTQDVIDIITFNTQLFKCNYCPCVIKNDVKQFNV